VDGERNEAETWTRRRKRGRGGREVKVGREGMKGDWKEEKRSRRQMKKNGLERGKRMG